MELKNKYAKGGEFKEDTPKIYVADLKSYNEGKLIGEWVDLTDYDSGEEVQDKIDSLMKEYSEKYHDGEETEPAIHDYENFDSSLYSEYMGKADYDIIIDTRKISEEKGIPAEVLQSISNDFSPDNLEEFVDDRYIGEYDGDYELGENYVDNVGGIEGVKNSEFYFDYEALGRDLSINNYNEYDGHYFQNYKKGGKVKEYDLSKYAKGGSLDKDLSGNYTSTDDFVYEHGLLDLAKEKFGDDWESGGDYDYDVEEIKLLSGGDYKIIYVDSERQNRDNFEEAKQKYFPKIKRKSNDGDIFVVRSMEKGGMITEESNYDIIANVKKEQGESDFYYALYDKLVAYGERPKIAFSEMKEVFDNYDEDMSDYIDLPFAKGGEIEDSYVWVEKDNIMDVEDFEEDGEVEFGSYKDMMESLDEWNEQLDTNYTTIKEFNDGEEYRRIMTIKEFEEYKKDWLKDEGYAKGGMLDDKDFKSELKKGKTFYFDEDEEGYTARVGYQDFFRTMKYYIFFNGTIVHSSKTFDSMKRKLNQLIKKYGLEFKGEEEFAKGGEVKKKENNSMLIGGLAGILLGIFLGRR
tara:strand:+ start:16950 stop:18674 length:1725 start_codon:yes stop_codon:yes gene_type:complete